MLNQFLSSLNREHLFWRKDTHINFLSVVAEFDI